MNVRRPAAADPLEREAATRRVRKRAAIALDLNGIAKGYGVDRLAETLVAFGIPLPSSA
jgi:FAD:protein FMN transferase